MKCLLIETKDKRKFFTHKKNLEQLNEFAKTFNSNMFIVELEKGEVLELEQLAPAVCSPDYKKIESSYKIIEEVQTKENNKFKKIEKQKIKDFISKELLTKKSISIKKIKNKFKRYCVSDSTYYNQFKIVKTELEKKGFKLLKIKAGIYKAKNN
jgi:hypothetical protein